MWWLSAALAADATAELERVFEAARRPQAAIVCSPARPVVELVSSVGARLPLPDVQDTLRALTPDALSAAGFDLDGTLAISAWDAEDALRIELPFSGAAAAAEALLTTLGKEPPVRNGATWDTHLGKQSMRARLEPGRLVLESPNPPSAAPPLPHGLLDRLPGGDGCAFALAAQKPGDKLHDIALSGAFIRGAPGLLRVRVNEPAPAALRGSSWRPSGGRSEAVPVAVITLGVPPAVLRAAGARSPRIASVVPLAEALLGPHGASLAVFVGGGAPSIALASARRGFLGVAQRPARILRDVERALAEAGQAATRADDGSLKLSFGRYEVFADAVPGRLILASSAEQMAALRASSGGRAGGFPWETPSLERRAREWPLTAHVAAIPGAAIDLAVRAVGGYWEMEIDGGGVAAAALVGAGAALAVPNFVSMQHKAKRAECPAKLDGIRVAELAYHEAFDVWLATPPHPRPAEEVDASLVDWVSTPEWARLGWHPDARVRGSYWVEIEPDGNFEAHCMMDVDGDGQRAHYVATPTREAHAISGEDVY